MLYAHTKNYIEKFNKQQLQQSAVFLAAVKSKFPATTDKQIKERIGSVLAGAGDREGGCKLRVPKRVSNNDGDNTNEELDESSPNGAGGLNDIQ